MLRRVVLMLAALFCCRTTRSSAKYYDKEVGGGLSFTHDDVKRTKLGDGP